MCSIERGVVVKEVTMNLDDGRCNTEDVDRSAPRARKPRDAIRVGQPVLAGRPAGRPAGFLEAAGPFFGVAGRV